MSGYQSDAPPPVFNGNIPAINTLGGFGMATKVGDTYELSLDPPLTGYKLGMQILMIVDTYSESGEKVDIDGNGAKYLARMHEGIWSFLEYQDFLPQGLYLIVYRGFFFEVLAGLPPKTDSRIWKTIGIFDASGDVVHFPSGKAGDVYVISASGAIDGRPVSKDDIIYCKNDNEGNPDDWIVIPHQPPTP